MVQQRLGHIILLVLIALCTQAQEERSFIREGNQFFNDSNFVMADSMYMKARDLNPESVEAQYNFANSLYNQNDFEGATAEYENLIPSLKRKDHKAIANHNLGNAYLKQNKPEEAIKAFKEALRNNPKDSESRYNLAYAQSLLQKNQNGQDKNNQNQEQDKNQQDKQDQKNQENNEGKDNKDGKNSDSKQNPNEENKNKKEGDPKDDKKGSQPDDQGEKDKSKESNKQEKGDEKGEDKGEQKKDSKEKPGEEENGEQPGEEGKESEEKSDKTGQGQNGESQPQEQKVKAISRAKAEQLLKELENNEKQIREKMIRSQMKQKPRQKIEKDW